MTEGFGIWGGIGLISGYAPLATMSPNLFLWTDSSLKSSLPLTIAWLYSYIALNSMSLGCSFQTVLVIAHPFVLTSPKVAVSAIPKVTCWAWRDDLYPAEIITLALISHNQDHLQTAIVYRRRHILGYSACRLKKSKVLNHIHRRSEWPIHGRNDGIHREKQQRHQCQTTRMKIQSCGVGKPKFLEDQWLWIVVMAKIGNVTDSETRSISRWERDVCGVSER